MSSSASGPALPTLIVTGGASDGLEVQLESPGAEKTIGSAPTSHVRLVGRNVDAGHARVAWEDAGVVLSDDGSAAGTFVNGEKVGAGHMLQDGDRISVGPPGSPESVRLLVRVPANLGAAAEAAPFLAVAAARGDQIPAFAAVPARTADELPAFTVEGGDSEPLIFEEAATPEPPPAAPPAPAPRPAPSPAPAIIFDESPAEHGNSVPEAESIPASPPPPAASGPVRTPRGSGERPEYFSDIPSIGGDRVREAIDLPPAEGAPAAPVPAHARARGGAVRRPRIPRAAIVAIVAAVVTVAAFRMYSRHQQPPPVLSSITPPKAEVGTTITITGSGFEQSAQGNTVRFGTVVAAVTDASPSSLAVTVPQVEGVAGGRNVPITVQGGGGRSNALFVKIARLPRVTRLEPDVALPGSEIVLRGQNLDGTPLSVRVGGEKVETRDVSAESVRVTVPDLPFTEGQSVPVSVEVGTDAARPMPLLLARLPLVLEVSPSSGTIGERVVIKGRGFEPTEDGNRVTIGGQAALVFSAAPTEIKAAVPAAEAAGTHTQVPVQVEVKGSPSSGRVTFTLVNPRSGLVRLRFFPAPVLQAPAGRHAFVATELGPVLLLSGRGDAPSTAERAGRVAAALTALVESAASRPVAFEVRDGAVPVVGVSGGPAVVSATAEDADGYAQKWDSALKASRSTPRQVAAHWAALLHDYVSLFGQGQRPSRTAEMSPRGKVLVDIYAEAQRRGTGGVPVATISGLSAAALRGVREMALLVPGGGATPGTAVAGRWEGMMADGAAERRIEVQLQVDGGRLGGSLTTRTGKLFVRTPLQQVSYDKGQLKFVTASGGSTRQFRGTLEGALLSGAIFKDATTQDAVGKFTLRYVD
jgi:hypothetical protein